MVWFTGTSTGNQYTVGSLYSNGNGTFRAEADGSFTNVRSGVNLVGSSQDPTVRWGGGAASSIASSGPGGGGYSTGAGSVGAPRTGGPGAGASSVSGRADASVSPGIGAGVRTSLKFTKGSSLAQLSGSAKGKGGATSAASTTQVSKYGEIVNKPHERVGNGGYQEPGTVSDIGWFKTRNGWALTYSEGSKERTEDDIMEQLTWAVRNRIYPSMVRDPHKPEDLPANGYQWNFITQEWVPDGGRYEREQEVMREMNDFRENGVLAPLSPRHEWGGDAPWLK